MINKKYFDGWQAGAANNTQGLLRCLPIDSALYAHVFSDNQDMSRVLHLMSLDMNEFKNGIGFSKERLARWGENTKIGKVLHQENPIREKISNEEKKLKEFNNSRELTALRKKDKQQLSGIYNIFMQGFDWFRKAPKEKQEEDLRKWKEDWVYAQLPQKQKELYIAEKERLIKELRKDKEYNKLEEKVKAYNKKIEPQRKELEERIIDQETELDGIRKAQAAPYTAADKLMESYELAIKKPYGQEIVPKEVSELIKSATDNIANGKYNDKEYPRLQQHFAWMADDKAFDMVIKEAKYLDKKNSKNNGSGRRVIDKEMENKLQNEVKDRLHEKYTGRGRAGVLAIKYYGALLAGAPTMYNGEEYAMTGLESEGKNEGLHDRDALQPKWLKNEKIKAYYDKYKEVNSLKAKSLKRPELSPLVNGHTLRLKPISEEPNHLYGVYRYNKDTDVIGIINGAGLQEIVDDKGNKTGEFRTVTKTIKQLDLSRGLLNDDLNKPLGVPTKLPEGTVYVDALNKDNRFVINAEGNLVNAKGGNIVIDKPALILHREVK
ncbi:MAG: hypothetical protein GX568_08060 [Candidatus Gastranaerophilales bacterium]|nr:hypothetical protein [Candidatus Gastranaerophilales bacterium]